MPVRLTLAPRAAGIPVIAALAIAISAMFISQGVAAQPAPGTVTGRVVWGSCLRGVPLPMAPDAGSQTQPAAPDVQPQPGRPVPVPTFGLPAGAVLVAAQNTSISARTDETGRFTLSGVPAGQFLTVAAGPVAAANAAVAGRPNVMVASGESVDIGTLSLGGQTAISPIICRGQLEVPNAAPGAEALGVEAPGDVPPPGTP